MEFAFSTVVSEYNIHVNSKRLNDKVELFFYDCKRTNCCVKVQMSLHTYLTDEI